MHKKKEMEQYRNTSVSSIFISVYTFFRIFSQIRRIMEERMKNMKKMYERASGEARP